MGAIEPTSWVEFAKEACVHAVQTVISCDVIGVSLSQQPKEARIAWFPRTKKQLKKQGIVVKRKEVPKDRFPVYAKKTEFKRSESLLAVLEAYTSILPENEEEIREAFGDIEARKAWCPLSVGIAIGIYRGIYQHEFSNLAIDVLIFCETHVESDEFFYDSCFQAAYLTWILVERGFISSIDLEDFASFMPGEDKFMDAVRELAENSLNTQFFVDFELPEGVSGNEAAFYTAMWYALRVATQVDFPPNKELYDIKPKGNLPDILAMDDNMEATLVLFGLITALSERMPSGDPYRLIVPSTLSKQTPFEARIQDVFKYIPQD